MANVAVIFLKANRTLIVQCMREFITEMHVKISKSQFKVKGIRKTYFSYSTSTEAI